MSNYSEEQITELQDAFAMFDDKGRGKIPAKTVKNVLRAVGQNPMMEDVQKMEKDLGKNPVDFDTFLSIYATFDKKPKVGMEDFIECLRAFDKDQNGTVSAAELRNMLVSLGDVLSQDDADTIIALADNHGAVEYGKLIHQVMGDN